jgi:DNA transformation protein
MNPSDSFAEFVLDQLQDLGGVDCVRMFGGSGLYHEGVFFGILYKGKMYLKVSEGTRPEFERRGMGPFRPNPRETMSSYYEVPVEILEDSEALGAWSREAIAAQVASGKKTKPGRRSTAGQMRRNRQRKK